LIYLEIWEKEDLKHRFILKTDNSINQNKSKQQKNIQNSSISKSKSNKLTKFGSVEVYGSLLLYLSNSQISLLQNNLYVEFSIFLRFEFANHKFGKRLVLIELSSFEMVKHYALIKYATQSFFYGKALCMHSRILMNAKIKRYSFE
jgi:hypothetical protein